MVSREIVARIIGFVANAIRVPSIPKTMPFVRRVKKDGIALIVEMAMDMLIRRICIALTTGIAALRRQGSRSMNPARDVMIGFVPNAKAFVTKIQTTGDINARTRTTIACV